MKVADLLGLLFFVGLAAGASFFLLKIYEIVVTRMDGLLM